MSPSLPTPAFLYILNIFLSPTLPKFPFFHNCHATPKGHGLPTPQNSERAPCSFLLFPFVWKNVTCWWRDLFTLNESYYSLIMSCEFCACVIRIRGVPQLQVIHMEWLYGCKWHLRKAGSMSWPVLYSRWILGKTGQVWYDFGLVWRHLLPNDVSNKNTVLTLITTNGGIL